VIAAVPDQVRELVVGWLSWFDVGVLLYFVAINTSYLLLISLAALEFARLLRRVPFAGYDEAHASPLTLPVSIVMAAFNERAGIIESVRGMLSLRYPQLEIVVVDDGSTDDTAELLTQAFDLRPVPRRVPHDVAARGEVLEILMSTTVPLTLVRTTNSGKSDSLNMGVNLARYPLLCFVDADSILDPEALLTCGKPFADDPARVVATGGVVRIANGSSVSHGRVVDVRVPTAWLPRIQIVEYLRAFLMGRTGWSRLGALTMVSGAFGMFRRDVVVDIGGLDPMNLGEDFDLVMRIHRRMRERRRPYRVVFLAEPVVWTEAPSTTTVLRRQRQRWHRGLAQTLWRHRTMIGNPRYGRIGLVALPYLVVFELLAPVLELVGLVTIGAGLAYGAVDLRFAALFGLVAFGYSFLLTLASLTLEEFSFHRYRRWSDLGWLVLATFAENIGYRQMTAVWRLQGLWMVLRRREHQWGTMTRIGFGAPTTPAPAARR
jgi:cellulose synthase/poly-beta-1,6-N-acetylglucosamine synthase-like glycosyltransferase